MDAQSMNAPRQFKQSSRKGKKAWRKNVDVTDIEQGLEELNEEIRKGGVVAEKEDDELFTVNTAGGDDEFTSRQKKVLRADQIIAQRSAVPGVSARKRPVSESATRGKVSDGLIVPKKLRSSFVSRKDAQRLRAIASGHKHLEARVDVHTDATFDVWANEPGNASTSEKSTALTTTTTTTDNQSTAVVPQPGYKKTTISYVEKKEVPIFWEKSEAKAPKTLAQGPDSLLANGRQIPAVLKPAGDYSYNPTFDDYESRLEREKEKAVRRFEREEAKRLRDEERQRTAERIAAEVEAAEARNELSEWDEDSAWEGFQTGDDQSDSDDGATSSTTKSTDANHAKKPNPSEPVRKTQAQRNRQRRHKAEQQKAIRARMIKRKNAQLQLVARLRQEAEATHLTTEAKLAERQLRLAQRNQRMDEAVEGDELPLRKLAHAVAPVPEKDIELVLPDELEDSLRRLRPEGNMLRDRYRTLLLQGKVESRRRVRHRQAWTKLQEKSSFRTFQLD